MAYKMLIFGLLLSAFGNFLETSSGDYLSPFTISKTESWQFRSIELNSNHVDKFDTIFLYFSVGDLKLNISTLVTEIFLPGDSSPKSCKAVQINKDFPDWNATCSYSVLTAGIFGPLRLRIRASESGQTIAEDRAFGYFYVYDKMTEEEDGSLTVMYSKDSVQTISQSNSLNFTFKLSEEQWILPGDYFVLYVADDFTYSSLEFKWLGSQAALGMAQARVVPDVQDKTVLFIYGIENELEGSKNYSVSFELNGFINPANEMTGGNYNWRLRVTRYATPTVYRAVRGAGPTKNVVAGKITVSSWLPNHAQVKSFIAAQLTTFTVMIFKIQNKFPADGTLTISVSGVVFCEKSIEGDSKQVPLASCGSLQVSYGSKSLTCVATDASSTSIVDCLGSESIPAGTTLTLTALTTIKASTISVTSITTKTITDSLIDYLEEPFSPKLTSVSLLTVNQHYVAKSFNNPDGVNYLGSSGTYGIVLAFNAPVDLVATDSFNLYMPVSTSTSRTSLSLGLTSSYFALYKIGAGLKFDSSTALDSAVDATSSKVVVGQNVISFTLEAPVTSGQGIVFYIGAGTKASPNNIFLPLMKTILSDLSESVLVLKKSNVNYIYAQPFSFTTNEVDLDFQLIPFCNNVFELALPLKVSISLPFDYNVGSLVAYLDFKHDLTTYKLKTGNFYPTQNLKADLTESGGLRLNLTKLAKDNEEWLIFAYPDDVEDLTGSISLKLIRNSEELEVFTKAFVVNSPASEVLFALNSQKSINIQGQDALSFIVDPSNLDGTAATTVLMRYAYLLPRGFELPKGTLTLLGHDSQYYETRSAYGSLSMNELVSTTFSQTLTAPWYKVEGLQYVTLVLAVGSAFSSSSCVYGSKQPYAVSNSLVMTYNNFSPTSQKAYSYGSIYTYLNLKLSLPGFVTPDSYVQVTLGDQWGGLYVSQETTWVTLGGTRYNGTFASSVWTSKPVTTKTSGTSTTLEVNVLAKLPEVTKDNVASFDSYVGFNRIMVYYNGLPDSVPEVFQWVQVTHDTDSRVKTKFSAGSMTAVQSKARTWAFPNVRGSKSVYFEVRFTVNEQVLKSSLISVDSAFSFDNDASSNTWCNFPFESAFVGSGVLVLTTLNSIPAGSEIRIIKDSAFDLTTEGLWKVKVSVQVDGKNVVDDSIDASSTQGFTVKQSPYVKVSSFSMLPEVTNAGTDSWYTLNITLNETLQNETFLHLQFNKNFNSNLGPSFTFEELPETFYIEAYSSSGSLILCESFHWSLSCYLGQMVSPSILFKLRLFNPSSTGSASVYFTNSSGNITVQPYYQTFSDYFSFNTSYQNCVDVYDAKVELNSQDKGLTHSVFLYLASDFILNLTSVFVIDFPLPYDLSSTDLSKTKCSILYQNSSTLKETQLFSSSPCSIQDNSVLMAPGLAGFNVSWLNWTILAIEGLFTPTEELSSNQFQSADQKLWFHTRNFRVALASIQMTGSRSQLSIGYVSFENIHATFASFQVSTNEKIVVNNGDRIVVAPGTYSGVFNVTTADSLVKSKRITLTGKPRDSSIQIIGDLVITSEQPSAQFWVGVPAATASGFYYVDWEIEEEAYGETLYMSPRPTLLEVDASLSYSLEFTNSLIVPPEYYSMPYPVSIVSSKRSVSPFEDLKIVFSHDLDVQIEFQPSTLVISAGETFASLQVYCANCSTGSVYQFQATLSQSSAFSLAKTQKFVFEYPYQQAATIEAQVNDLKPNSFEVQLYSDSFALVTWCLAGEDFFNPYFVSQEYLLSNVEGLGSDEGVYGSLEEQVSKYYEYLYTLLEESESYEEFSLEALIYSRQLYIVSQDQVQESETKTIAAFEQLTPGTTYYFYMYVDNYSGYSSASYSTSVTTPALPSHAKVQMADFLETSELVSKMSDLLHVDTSRILPESYNRRRLQVSQSFTVLSSMTSDSSGYQLISKYSNQELGQVLGTEILSISALSPEDMDAGDWASEPEWSLEDEMLWINFTSTVDGKFYCEVEVNPNMNYSQITAQQILFKVDRTGTTNTEHYAAMEVLAYQNSSHSFNFTGYGEVPVVTSCIICNNYPLTPECSEVKNFTYVVEEEKSSFSKFLIVLGGFVLFS